MNLYLALHRFAIAHSYAWEACLSIKPSRCPPTVIKPDHLVGIRLEVGNYSTIESTQPKLFMKLILGKSYGILKVPVSRRQYDALVLP